MTEIALYDLDRTITKKPTYLYFLLYAARRHAPWRLLFLPAIIVTSIGYLFGLLSRGRLKEVNQAIMLGRSIGAEELAAIGAGFAEETLHDNIYPQAIARAAEDKAKGRRLVLASASYAFYVVPIARLLGFDDVIATGSKRDEDGRVLAAIDGENCYGPAKLRMIERWMTTQATDRGAMRVRFHSDSESDLPVFEWSDDPIAVNPTHKLRKIADKRGWPIIAWG